MSKKEKIYCVYIGDKFIDVGTVKELSKRLKLDEKTIRFYACSKRYKEKQCKERIWI